MAETFRVIREGELREVAATVSGARVAIAPDALRDALGWKLEPEGLCQGDVCVPVRDRTALECDGGVDLSAFAQTLELPLALEIGDRITFLSTGAYTASYASIGFNGYPPLDEYYI